MVALISESNSSSPRIASCKWRGVIRFTLRSLEALPASSSTSAVRYSRIAALYTAAVAPTLPWLVVRVFKCLWMRPTGNCSPALCERDTALALAFPLSFPALPPAMVSAAPALGPAEPSPPLPQHRPPLPPPSPPPSPSSAQSPLSRFPWPWRRGRRRRRGAPSRGPGGGPEGVWRAETPPRHRGGAAVLVPGDPAQRRTRCRWRNRKKLFMNSNEWRWMMQFK